MHEDYKGSSQDPEQSWNASKQRLSRVGVPDEVMEGLDFEEEEGDWDKGEVDDVNLGEQEVVGEMG